MVVLRLSSSGSAEQPAEQSADSSAEQPAHHSVDDNKNRRKGHEQKKSCSDAHPGDIDLVVLQGLSCSL